MAQLQQFPWGEPPRNPQGGDDNRPKSIKTCRVWNSCAFETPLLCKFLQETDPTFLEAVFPNYPLNAGFFLKQLLKMKVPDGRALLESENLHQKDDSCWESWQNS